MKAKSFQHSLRTGLLFLLRIRFAAHLGSGPRYSGFVRNLPTKGILARFVTIVEKAALSKVYENPKTKIGGNHAFFRDK